MQYNNSTEQLQMVLTSNIMIFPMHANLNSDGWIEIENGKKQRWGQINV